MSIFDTKSQEWICHEFIKGRRVHKLNHLGERKVLWQEDFDKLRYFDLPESGDRDFIKTEKTHARVERIFTSLNNDLDGYFLLIENQ